MLKLFAYCVIALLVSVSGLHVPAMVNPITSLDPEENEVLKPFPTNPKPKDDPGTWTEATVIRMYYDCRYRLVRQEVSKLRTRNEDGMQVEEKLNLSKGINERKTNTKEELKLYKSIPSRIAHPKYSTTSQPTLGGKPESFKPDMIIGSPRISCPNGKNDDNFGNCRTVFPEKTD